MTILKWNKTIKTNISYINSLILKFSMRINVLIISTTNTIFIIEFIDKIITKTKKHKNWSNMSSIWKICWKFFIELILTNQMLIKSFNIKNFVVKRIKNKKLIKLKKKTICLIKTFISIDAIDLFRAFLRL